MSSKEKRLESSTDSWLEFFKDKWFERLLPYLFLAPTLLVVIVFTIYPAISTVVNSFYEPGRRADAPFAFVGLDNYLDLFDKTHYLGSRFSQVMGNTFYFSGITILVGMALAFLLALLLNRKIKGLWLWRFAIIYPLFLPTIGAASFWAFHYSDTVGLINTVLRDFNLPTVNWLGDPSVVLLSITVVNIWKQTGYYTIFYLTGLQNIPKDIYEAADLDGADYWQQLLFITIPLLRRSTLFISTIGFIFAFQTVEQLQVLNMGNPADRGNLLMYFIFQNIPERRNYGYINAMTVILILILLIFTISNFYFSESGKEENHA